MKHLSIAAFLVLAACGSSEDAGSNNSSSPETAGAAIEQTPANLMDDPNNSVVPIRPDDVTRVEQTVSAIPAAFTGRWGMVANDCDPQRADNKGLLTVAADKLSFYESRAVPGNIRLASPNKLTTDLAFSGEGQTWQQTARLTLMDDGKTLIREAIGGEKGDEQGAQRYSRCPAGAAK